jgi:hypothetical protein
MSQNFQTGDFLIFQIESGFGLLRILEIEETENDTIWHLASFSDLFLDVETADAALENYENLTVEKPHVALTNRAFEATQTARMKNVPLNENDLKGLNDWKINSGEVSDRSIRLMLGLR